MIVVKYIDVAGILTITWLPEHEEFNDGIVVYTKNPPYTIDSYDYVPLLRMPLNKNTVTP